MFFFKQSSPVNANLKKEIEENNGIIIDVRSPGEQLQGILPDAVGADWLSGEFHRQSTKWDPAKHYYLYCRSGNRSGAAADFLRSKGFKNVTNIGAYQSLAGLF